MRYFKILLVAILAILPLDAMADFGKFVAAEFQSDIHKDTNKKTTVMPTFNMITGVKPHEQIGLELGAYISGNHKTKDYTLHKKAVHASVVGYYPISYDTRLRFGAGATQLFAKCNMKGNEKKLHSGLIPRVFGGVEFDIGDTLTTRINLIWEQTSVLENSHKAFRNDSLHLNIGLGYNI
jgi:hypothetical protein